MILSFDSFSLSWCALWLMCVAGEIVSTIKSLKAAMEKPGGGKASRRNTRIGTATRPMMV